MGGQIDPLRVEAGEQSKDQTENDSGDRNPEDVSAEKIEDGDGSQKREYRA